MLTTPCNCALVSVATYTITHIHVGKHVCVCIVGISPGKHPAVS